MITAEGGKFGAGIGTGYHAAHLEGKIDASVVVNAKGSIYYREGKTTYTMAQDVGFGVLDLTRDGEYSDGRPNDCTFDYKGTIITVPEAFILP